MNKIIYLLILVLCCLGCNIRDAKTDPTDQDEIAFDKTKWNTKDGNDYVYRNKMLNDLVYNQNLKTFKKDEILDFLGKPERIDNNHLFYLVDQKHISFVPIQTKTLVIKLAEDDTVIWVKIAG